MAHRPLRRSIVLDQIRPLGPVWAQLRKAGTEQALECGAFLRPGAPILGFAYAFAGDHPDDPLGFDPIPFGISPREAQQVALR